MMHRTPRGHVLARGMLALLALGSFGLGPLLTSVHLSVVRHTVCAEHGELIEVEQQAAPARASPLALALTSRDAGLADPHAHHHCDAASQRVAPTLRPDQARDLAQTIADGTPAVQVHRSACEPHIALLRLAPKASPPV